MRLGPRKLAVVVAGVAAVVAVAVAAAVGTGVALVALAVVQVLAAGGVGYLTVSVDRERRRVDAARSAAAVRDLTDEVTRWRGDLAADVAELRREVRDLADTERGAATQLTTTVETEVAGLRRELSGLERRVRRGGLDDVAQVEALIALYHEVRPSRALPGTRGWAASPDLLLWCWRHVLETAPALVVECGSGVSTVVLAAACARVGRGRVIALEHDGAYAATTRRLLEEHGLAAVAEVRHAPLRPLADGERRWYDLGAVPDGPIDLAVVDGPPGGADPEARVPAIDVLHPRLSSRAVVVLDDVARPGERALAERWTEQHPELVLEVLPHEKGTGVLRRRAD